MWSKGATVIIELLAHICLLLLAQAFFKWVWNDWLHLLPSPHISAFINHFSFPLLPISPFISLKRKKEGNKWTEWDRWAEKRVCVCLFVRKAWVFDSEEKSLQHHAASNPACFPKPAQGGEECDLNFPSMQQCSPVDKIPCFLWCP